MDEIIYILINEAMPGYIKIGLTNNDLIGRIKGLDNTSVPLPFECFYAARVKNAKETERLLHDVPPKDGPSETGEGRAFGDRAFGDIYEIVLLEQRKKTPAGCFFLMLRRQDSNLRPID